MSPVPIYTPGWRETKWSKVPCLRKQCDGQEAQTSRSGAWGINHSATHASLGMGKENLISYWLAIKLEAIRSTTLIWIVMHHQYGISELVPQTSFCRRSSGGIAKWHLSSQANIKFTFMTWCHWTTAPPLPLPVWVLHAYMLVKIIFTTIFTLLPGNEQWGSRAGMLKSRAGQTALQLDSAYCEITIIGTLNDKQSQTTILFYILWGNFENDQLHVPRYT